MWALLKLLVWHWENMINVWESRIQWLNIYNQSINQSISIFKLVYIIQTRPTARSTENRVQMESSPGDSVKGLHEKASLESVTKAERLGRRHVDRASNKTWEVKRSRRKWTRKPSCNWKRLLFELFAMTVTKSTTLNSRVFRTNLYLFNLPIYQSYSRFGQVV